jgi:hypothetical protein
VCLSLPVTGLPDALTASAVRASVQVSQPTTVLPVPPYTTWLTLVVIILIIIIVIWPAVWSRQAARRRAATEVLALLTRSAFRLA